MDADRVAIVGDGVGVRLLLAEAEQRPRRGVGAWRRDVDDALAPLAFDLPALCEPEKLLLEGQAPLKRADDEVEMVGRRPMSGRCSPR